ncbi:hypothetical protein [Zhongshania sp.]|uniref:hypothetical protein n=1 Tax=Zhongshania sp. TaxID=1971902 RepID=UPI003567E363
MAKRIILELPGDIPMIEIRRFLVEHGLVFHRSIDEPGDDLRVICQKKWAPRIVEQLNGRIVGEKK